MATCKKLIPDLYKKLTPDLYKDLYATCSDPVADATAIIALVKTDIDAIVAGNTFSYPDTHDIPKDSIGNTIKGAVNARGTVITITHPVVDHTVKPAQQLIHINIVLAPGTPADYDLTADLGWTTSTPRSAVAPLGPTLVKKP